MFNSRHFMAILDSRALDDERSGMEWGSKFGHFPCFMGKSSMDVNTGCKYCIIKYPQPFLLSRSLSFPQMRAMYISRFLRLLNDWWYSLVYQPSEKPQPARTRTWSRCLLRRRPSSVPPILDSHVMVMQVMQPRPATGPYRVLLDPTGSYW